MLLHDLFRRDSTAVVGSAQTGRKRNIQNLLVLKNALLKELLRLIRIDLGSRRHLAAAHQSIKLLTIQLLILSIDDTVKDIAE